MITVVFIKACKICGIKYRCGQVVELPAPVAMRALEEGAAILRYAPTLETKTAEGK